MSKYLSEIVAKQCDSTILRINYIGKSSLKIVLIERKETRKPRKRLPESPMKSLFLEKFMKIKPKQMEPNINSGIGS